MSNSLWFSRIFTLQSFSWFCFNYSYDCFLGVLEKRLLREWDIFITIGFENFQNFKFFSFPFLKFINFKITTNSFTYSLLENFLKPIFTKVITGGKGVYILKKLVNFLGFIYPLTWGVGVYYTSNTPLYPKLLNHTHKLMYMIIKRIFWYRNMLHLMPNVHQVCSSSNRKERLNLD